MKDPKKVSLAYAISIHKSQGLTINTAIPNLSASPIADQELWNVAMTRARYVTWVAVVKSEKAKVLEAFKRENSKVNLYDLALELAQQAKQAPAVTPNQVAALDATIQATQAATAAIPSTTTQPGRFSVLTALKAKLKSFGKISNAVFAPRKPPIAIIKQRNAAIAAQQVQTAQQVKAVQQAKPQQQPTPQPTPQRVGVKKQKGKGMQL